MYWDDPQRWVIWATGKTILGALLGGYAGVEAAKKWTGYTQPTGDWFALDRAAGHRARARRLFAARMLSR